jgi:DNA-directed RNA polymerase specialized sigma24 family protein
MVNAGACLILPVLAWSGGGRFPAFLADIFLCLATVGLILSNATAAAMAQFPPENGPDQAKPACANAWYQLREAHCQIGSGPNNDLWNCIRRRVSESRRSIVREVWLLLDENSDTVWIDGIKAGDGTDIHRLWDRYFERLVRLASARLPTHSRRSFDEENVALSAFQSFCDRAGRGQFPQLSGRDDLWRLLGTITVRKALNTIRHQNRQKRGGGRVLGESALPVGKDADGEGEGLAQVLGREPTPEEVAGFADDYRHLLARLLEPSLRTVALQRLEGLSTREIAESLNVSPKTVERKLQLIRAIWSQESPR